MRVQKYSAQQERGQRERKKDSYMRVQKYSAQQGSGATLPKREAV